MMKRERKGDKSETEQKKIQACLNYNLPKSLLKSFNKPDSKSHHKLNTIEVLNHNFGHVLRPERFSQTTF